MSGGCPEGRGGMNEGFLPEFSGSCPNPFPANLRCTLLPFEVAANLLEGQRLRRSRGRGLNSGTREGPAEGERAKDQVILLVGMRSRQYTFSATVVNGQGQAFFLRDCLCHAGQNQGQEGSQGPGRQSSGSSHLRHGAIAPGLFGRQDCLGTLPQTFHSEERADLMEKMMAQWKMEGVARGLQAGRPFRSLEW